MLLPCLAAFVLAVAVYAVTVGGTYVYDDLVPLRLDDRLEHPGRWGRYWTEGYHYGADNLYRPLASMSFAVGWWVHGHRPWAFHVVNVLLHAAASAAVAALAGRLTKGSSWRGRPAGGLNLKSQISSLELPPVRAAWAAGLLFAVHPVHAEVVAGLYGRADSMCTLAIVAGLLVLTGGPVTAGRALGVWACFVTALLSKEQGMLFPVLALGAVVASRGPWSESAIRNLKSGIRNLRFGTRNFRSGIAGPQRPNQTSLALVAAICLTLAGYVVWRESILKFWWDRAFLDFTIQPMIRSEGVDRWLIPVALLGRYAGLMVFPWRLSIDYGVAVIGSAVSIADPYLWLGVLAGGAWAAAVVAAVVRRRPAEAFALIAAAVTYAPVSNALTLIGTVFGERLIYLPSAFLLIWAALIAARLPRRAWVAALALAVAAGSVRSAAYAARWTDAMAFYESSLADQPKSVRLRLIVGNEHLKSGRPAAAAVQAAVVRRLAPDYADGWALGVLAAAAQGDVAEAERLFPTATRLNPFWGQTLSAKIEQARAVAAR